MRANNGPCPRLGVRCRDRSDTEADTGEEEQELERLGQSKSMNVSRTARKERKFDPGGCGRQGWVSRNLTAGKANEGPLPGTHGWASVGRQQSGKKGAGAWTEAREWPGSPRSPARPALHCGGKARLPQEPLSCATLGWGPPMSLLGKMWKAEKRKEPLLFSSGLCGHIFDLCRQRSRPQAEVQSPTLEPHAGEVGRGGPTEATEAQHRPRGQAVPTLPPVLGIPESGFLSLGTPVLEQRAPVNHLTYGGLLQPSIIFAF